jgi:hypothetical protein
MAKQVSGDIQKERLNRYYEDVDSVHEWQYLPQDRV